MTKVISFEDNELHADILRIYLQNLGYKDCGIFNNVKEAVTLVAAISPDIILMDIDFKEDINGIQAARRIGNLFNLPLIYLSSLTAKSVIDEARTTFPESYLVKPFTEEQLKSAIEIAIYKYQSEWRPSGNKNLRSSPGQELFVKVDRSLIKVAFNKIVYIEAMDKYSIIHTEQKKYTVLNHIGHLTEKLSNDFIRVHRSFIVNLQAIKNIRMNDNMIDMGIKVLPFSKMYKQELFAQLNVL